MKVIAVVLLCILISQTQAASRYKTCSNPNQTEGLCVPISLCLPLHSVLVKSNPTQSEIEFIRNSRCESDKSKHHYVCCTTDKDYNRTPEQIPREDSSLLPDRSICGGDQLVPGNKTILSGFPWLVVLEYRKSSEEIKKNGCMGSLINHRYVLTVARCLSKSFGNLVSVQLGEHGTSAAEDCRNGSLECNGMLRVEVEDIHIHVNFTRGFSEYDIGLIRLEREVAYTPNIRPVCLPSTVGVQHWEVHEEFTGAAWRANQTPIDSLVQLKFEATGVDLDSCRSEILPLDTLHESHLCANGPKEVDGCLWSFGGPLMAFQEGVWVLGGIATFGLASIPKKPYIYTNVIYIESWIKQTIRP
uniref:CLIP domain-containing serine protease n=1 Tax=Drosophila erecta TaxID=7220 RepID=B3P545_DROER